MTKYTTIAGDMWDGIAYKTLGDETYTDKIIKANPEFRRLFVFPAGIVLNNRAVDPRRNHYADKGQNRGKRDKGAGPYRTEIRAGSVQEDFSDDHR